MAKIRVFLTDDHTLFRQGIKTLIGSEPDMEIVGEASNAIDEIAQAAEVTTDVVLMDIGMTGLDSFEATRQIRKNRPRPGSDCYPRRVPIGVLFQALRTAWQVAGGY